MRLVHRMIFIAVLLFEMSHPHHCAVGQGDAKGQLERPAPLEFDKLPYKRRSVEKGDVAGGWRWAAIRNEFNIADLSLASRPAVALLVTHRGA
jgi:hypothetical protein